MKKFIIITTINEKTRAVAAFENMPDWHTIVVGDQKSKPIRNSESLTFLSLEDQRKLGFRLGENLPLNHYTRKNIGYLYAIREGADIIYDTDDDNVPYPDWKAEDSRCENILQSQDLWINVYRYFTRDYIWPRGFPLDLINQEQAITVKKTPPVRIGVWQGLTDIDPDVDAIYRLVLNKPVTFEARAAIALPVDKFCPFNSQNTLWFREAFPFLYLPAKTSFRFTDILRGLIAQRLMWLSGMQLGFHKATVYQKRAPHNLMDDFTDEVECYLSATTIVNALQEVDYAGNPLDNLFLAYKRLHADRLINADEMLHLDAWRKDLEQFL